jgi:hypothetical protein
MKDGKTFSKEQKAKIVYASIVLATCFVGSFIGAKLGADSLLGSGELRIDLYNSNGTSLGYGQLERIAH